MFKTKKNVINIIIYFKIQLVAQEFSQVPKFDYFNIYTSIAKLALI